MIQQPQEILTLVRHNITDHDLPLVKARNSNTPAHELRRKTQPHKTLDTKDDEDFGGGHRSISRVKIHLSHYDFHDILETNESDSTFAVKRLHSRNCEMFSREVNALKRLSGQKHVVPLLATFEYKNSYHLLFPWANANLRRYWAMFPNPSINKGYGLWVVKQSKGMAEGLSIIFEPRAD
ncbi:hypothetical protein CEP54_015227 [Fusarium duplospermum]|uniref:Uncharacterized protein n=1 Tax=Fusarium duplospermum TaxID=1325734 RepID=A0A428NQQ7_9HYPO|nr:hypothetical protein CEP54_015227 [Fusarium duplospermum]